MGFLRRWFKDGQCYQEGTLMMPKNVEKPTTTLAKMIALAILDFTKPIEYRLHWEDRKERGITPKKLFTVKHPKFSLEGFISPADRYWEKEETYHLYTHRCLVAGGIPSFDTNECLIITGALIKWAEGEDKRKAIKAEADRQQKAIDALEAWMGCPPQIKEITNE